MAASVVEEDVDEADEDALSLVVRFFRAATVDMDHRVTHYLLFVQSSFADTQFSMTLPTFAYPLHLKSVHNDRRLTGMTAKRRLQ